MPLISSVRIDDDALRCDAAIHSSGPFARFVFPVTMAACHRLFTSNESRVIWWRTMKELGKERAIFRAIASRILDAASDAPPRYGSPRSSPEAERTGK